MLPRVRLLAFWPALDSLRSQRRLLRCGKLRRPDQGLSRNHSARRSRIHLRLRHRPAAALRHRILSTGRAQAVALCGQHGLSGPLPLSERRPDHPCSRHHGNRQAARRRRSLDTRHRVLVRRNANVRLCRLALQRWRSASFSYRRSSSQHSRLHGGRQFVKLTRCPPQAAIGRNQTLITIL